VETNAHTQIRVFLVTTIGSNAAYLSSCLSSMCFGFDVPG
jgi:hypothetical protein